MLSIQTHIHEHVCFERRYQEELYHVHVHVHVHVSFLPSILYYISFSSLFDLLSFLFQDPGGQQVGFLLGSLGVSVALTSEATAKALPKEEGKDHIVHFKVTVHVHVHVVRRGIV